MIAMHDHDVQSIYMIITICDYVFQSHKKLCIMSHLCGNGAGLISHDTIKLDVTIKLWDYLVNIMR